MSSWENDNDDKKEVINDDDDDSNDVLSNDNNNDCSSSDDNQRMLSESTMMHEAPLCTLLTSTFNQDGGCLAIGTNQGFMVHNLYPQYTVSVQRDLFHDGVQIIEMLFRCNLMAFVKGNGQSSPMHTNHPNHHRTQSSSSLSSSITSSPSLNNNAHPSQSHRVFIWDDHLCKEIGELSFRQTVLAVKLRKDSIAVALRDRIYVYNLADLTLRDKIYTADNPYGLLSVSTQISDIILACPSTTVGNVRVELYHVRKTVLIEAHTSALRQISLTSDGHKLATCSTKGTIIRIWNVSTGICFYEFRRGIERANISCLCWNSWADNTMLACTSDHGTVHIFQIANDDPNNNQDSSNKQQTGKKNNNNNDRTSRYDNYYSSSSSSSNNSKQNQNKKKKSKSLTSRLLSTVSKSLLHSSDNDIPQEKSICQIRGIPHPQSCGFVSEANNVLAVAGYDADGNGVLLLSDFSNVIGKGIDEFYHDQNNTNHQRNHYRHENNNSKNGQKMNNNNNNSDEPIRIGYHILCRSLIHQDETEEERRRRRLRGTFNSPQKENTEDNNNAHIEINDRVEQDINFEDGFDEDDFVTVTTGMIKPSSSHTTTAKEAEEAEQQQHLLVERIKNGNTKEDRKGGVADDQSNENFNMEEEDFTDINNDVSIHNQEENNNSVSESPPLTNTFAHSGTIGDSIHTESLGRTQEIADDEDIDLVNGTIAAIEVDC